MRTTPIQSSAAGGVIALAYRTPGGTRSRSELDRLRIAHHEAAHVEVLRALGGMGRAAIWRTRTRRPEEEKYWKGRVTIIAPPVPGGERRPWQRLHAPRDWKVLVGMAGPIADAMLELGTDLDADGAVFNAMADDISSAMDGFLDGMSETDLAFITSSPVTYNRISRAIAVVRRLWPQIESSAEHLRQFEQC